MRKYKHLTIPDRIPRTVVNSKLKQNNYCLKTDCHGPNVCKDCLFDVVNLSVFEEWYMSKNKSKKGSGAKL